MSSPPLVALPSSCRECIAVDPYTTPEQRIAKLAEISRAGASNPLVVGLARNLYQHLRATLRREPTPAEMVQWLMDANHMLMDYLPDPPGEEVFQSVRWSLAGGGGSRLSPLTGEKTGAGDCEDMASTIAALGLALGIPMRCRWWQQEGAPLNHVSAEAFVDGRWQVAEATLPGARFGEGPYEALARVGSAHRDRVLGS